MASRAGSPNKNKAFLLNRLKDMFGNDFDPIIRMAEQATELHRVASERRDIASLKASIDAWDKVAVYVEPKLKATSYDPELGEPVPFVIQIVEPSREGCIASEVSRSQETVSGGNLDNMHEEPVKSGPCANSSL